MTTVDFDYRPNTYWPWLPSHTTMLARIKGVARREAAREVLTTGGPAALDTSLFEESLMEEERRMVGQVHPFFMGGEYLPDLGDSEIEIARIELASTMRDVISIRARPVAAGIGYAVVDEYETTFAFSQQTSSRPLRLRELITLIQSIEAHTACDAAYPGGSGLPTRLRETQIDSDLEAAATFVTVSSELYSQLEDYYVADARAWLRRMRVEWGVGEEKPNDDRSALHGRWVCPSLPRARQGEGIPHE